MNQILKDDLNILITSKLDIAQIIALVYIDTSNQGELCDLTYRGQQYCMVYDETKNE